jgi:crossover junction endodeoxyribonuclease RuvC
MIIIGVDPGLQKTGWAVIKLANRGFQYLDSGVIKTKTDCDMASRLLTIHDGLSAVLASYSPITAGIENTYVNTNYGSSLKLAHARAAIILTLARLAVSVSEYSAKTVKKTFTGTGNADKEQMLKMVSLLMPNANVKSADAADALAIALCHGHHLL